MRNLLRILGLLLPFLAGNAVAQVPAVAPAQSKPIALTGATLHIGDGTVVENGIIAFDKGKITYAGATSGAIDMSSYEKIDVSGKHIYPGMIQLGTTLGLEEISAVRASRDYQEVGGLNPHVRAIVAYNTDSEVINTLRFNGILLAQTTPQGGIVSGASSVVQLDAWNWEDAAYRVDDGLHLNWPRRYYGPRWWRGETSRRPNKDYEEQIQGMKQLMAEAKAYAAKKPEAANLRLQSMTGLFDGSKTLYIHADKSKAIVSGCRFAKEMGVKKVVVMGGDDAWMITDFLKEHDIPVVLTHIHRLPSRDDAGANLPYEQPGMLQKAGVKFALGFGGGMFSTMRNLPFAAGTAVAHGLDPEEALKAVTSTSASILGIDDRTGMLKKGLDANIAVSEGDIFDMLGNNMFKVYIQGRDVNLNGKQQYLYNKFREKYEQDGK